MSTPRFSVIVPVYNAQKYLEECIESVLAQTFKNFELILVNDGSADESGHICDRFSAVDERVTAIHQQNAGHITARMNGVKVANGEYIVFIDSDDSVLPSLLKTADEKINEHCCDLLVYRLKRGDEICHDFFCGEKDSIAKADFFETNLAESGLNSLVIKICRRELFANVDVTPFSAFTNSEDLLLSIQLVKQAAKISYIPDVLYLYRVNETSITHTVNKYAMEEYAFSREIVFNELDKYGKATPDNRSVLLGGFLRRASDWLLQVSLSKQKTAEKFACYTELARLPMMSEALQNGIPAEFGKAKKLRLRLLAGGSYRTLLTLDKLRGLIKK